MGDDDEGEDEWPGWPGGGRGESHSSHLLSAGWFWKVQRLQFQPSDSSSSSVTVATSGGGVPLWKVGVPAE